MLAKYLVEYVFKKGYRVYPTLREYSLNYDVFNSLEKPKEMENQGQENDEINDNGLILPSMLSSESEDSD